MPKSTSMINSFNAGEFSPVMRARVDFAKYQNACETLLNMLPAPQGGVFKRSGTYYVAGVKTDSKKVRLIPFEFSVEQAYVCEFGDQYIRFYMDGGQILNGGSPYEIASPYLEADLFDLKFAQSADTMWIVHPSYQPRKLTRTAHTTWTLSLYAPTANPFDGANKYPRAVAFFEERLWFAGTNNQPQRLFSTKSGDFEDMTTGTADADACRYTIAADQVNVILWMVPSKVLVVGTVGGEWRVGSNTLNEAITPSNVRVVRETTHGSDNLQAIPVGNSILFVQRAGRKIRELAYNWETDAYVAPDMTVLAEHVTAGSIRNMGYSEEPYSVIWAVRNDGVLLAMTYDRLQNIVAWSRHTTDGEIESVAVIPSSTVDEYEVWISVKRTISGATKRYVEYFTQFRMVDEQEDCFFLDSGLTFYESSTISNITNANPAVVTSTGHPFENGDTVLITGVLGMTEINGNSYTVVDKAANTFKLSGCDATAWGVYTSGGLAEQLTDTLSGLTHLEGKTVSILADGAVHPDKTVTAGAITLDYQAAKIHVGLGYEAQLKPMPLEGGSATGTAQTKTKRISEVALILYKSLNAKAGPDEDHLDLIPFRQEGEPMDAPPVLFTGTKELSYPEGWEILGQPLIVSDTPTPLNVLAIVADVSVSDG